MDPARLRAIVEQIVGACEGCRLTGPADNQIQFQKAVREYREHFPKEQPE